MRPSDSAVADSRSACSDNVVETKGQEIFRDAEYHWLKNYESNNEVIELNVDHFRYNKCSQMSCALHKVPVIAERDSFTGLRVVISGNVPVASKLLKVFFVNSFRKSGSHAIMNHVQII